VVDRIVIELDRFDGVVARLARELVARCADLNRQTTSLEPELRTVVRQVAPSLLAVPGCGVLSAALLVGEAAGVERFRSKDHFARFGSTPSIPVWSGASEGKVRLNRGGNRLTNTALHMIAVTQCRTDRPGRVYLEKVQARGKTPLKPSGCSAGASPAVFPSPPRRRQAPRAGSPIHATPHDANCALT
jgi:transposase